MEKELFLESISMHLDVWQESVEKTSELLQTVIDDCTASISKEFIDLGTLFDKYSHRNVFSPQFEYEYKEGEIKIRFSEDGKKFDIIHNGISVFQLGLSEIYVGERKGKTLDVEPQIRLFLTEYSKDFVGFIEDLHFLSENLLEDFEKYQRALKSCYDLKRSIIAKEFPFLGLEKERGSDE